MPTRELRATIGPMKLLLVALIGLAPGACAASDGYDKSLSRYAGAPEQVLIARWGALSSVDEAGGIRYLSYRPHRASYIPAVTPLHQPICPPSICVPLGGAKGFMLNEQCTTTFAVEDGKVRGSRWEGRACGG